MVTRIFSQALSPRKFNPNYLSFLSDAVADSSFDLPKPQALNTMKALADGPRFGLLA